MSPKDITVLRNLDCLGVRVIKQLNDSRSRKKPILEAKNTNDSYELSRFVPLCKILIEEYINENLSYTLFPSTKDIPVKSKNTNPVHGSLRTGKPTWAKKDTSISETAQRIFLFIVGGATYSESRICYEISKTHGRDVILITTNMLTTKKWLQNLSMLKLPRELLCLPIDQPPLKIPLLQTHSKPEKNSKGALKTTVNHSNYINNDDSDDFISKKLSDYNINETLKNSQKEKRDKKKLFGVF